MNETSEIRRWAGRRRAAGIFGAVGVVFFGTILGELDHPIYITDEVVVGALGTATLLLYLTYRKRSGLSDLKRHTNIFTVLMAIAFAGKIAWYFVESGDPDAAGDDLGAIFFLVTILLNRFM